jgi:hypothetical protein
MNIEEIAKDMARDGYNPKDDGANNRALKEYLQTQAGLENYKEWITSMVAERYNSEDVEESLKSCTMADWLDDMLNTPGEPIAKDILDDWRDKEIVAWTRILEVLESTHDKVKEAAEDPDGKYYLELSKNLGTLYVMDNDDYSVVEAYDLWAIQGELEKYDSDWTEADYSSIKDVVR